MDELSSIKEMRRRLGLTQQKLAKIAGVSQSLIAKIEAGRIDPAYSKAVRIIDALRQQQSASEKKAKDVMHSGVEAIPAQKPIHEAAAAMRKKGISQMPVVEGKQVVGSISEQAIVAQFAEGQKKIASLKVKDAMEPAFPTAPPSTPLSAIAALLQHHPAVLIVEKGEMLGIITKADLLKAV